MFLPSLIAEDCQPTPIKYNMKTSLEGLFLSYMDLRWGRAVTLYTDPPIEGKKEVTRRISGFHEACSKLHWEKLIFVVRNYALRFLSS